MNKKYTWLRWVGVLPVSLLVFFLIYISVKTWIDISEKDSPGVIGVMNIVGPIASGIAASYCYIWSGIKLAPAFKRNTGLILSVLMILFIGALLYNDIIKRLYSGIITDIGAVIGLAIAFIEIEKKTQKGDLEEKESL